MRVVFMSGEDNVDRPSCSKLSEASTAWGGGEVGSLRPPELGVLLLLRNNEKVL